jgi:acyl-CoA synthetase (AMP-forming)/AMP-acid ligase II
VNKHFFSRLSVLYRHNFGIGRYSSTAAQKQEIFSQDDPKLWVKSPHPDIPEIKDVTVQEMVWSKLSKGKDREKLVAFKCGLTGRKYTFGELYKYSRAFAASLIHAGFKKGDILGVVLPNVPEYAIVYLGALEAGLIVSPVNPAYTPDEIKRQLQGSEVKCAITIPAFVPPILEAQKVLPALSHIVVIGESQPGCHNFFEMIKTDTTGVKFFTGKEIDTEDDVAILPYSSGTTGPPKGVMLSHYNIVNNFNQFNRPHICTVNEYDGGEQARLLGLLPFFHSYGFAAILILGLHHGASTICLPRFEPESFLKTIREFQPTTLHLVPPLVSFIANSPEFGAKELAGTDTILASAAPIGSSLVNRVLEKAGKYLFFQEGYGMTELSPVSHIMCPEAKNTKVGSCGTPISNTLTKIVHTETGKTLGRNERGELCVKGRQVMKGYYKNEEATRNTIDSDGWLHTGDIAYYDDDGYCYIVDRLKELIKVKGFQVAPSELEDLLRELPGVSDVAVIGVPHEEWGELPRAYIVRKDGSLNDDQVNGHLAGKVTSFKQLRGGIEYVEAIPKAPSGKILRRELIKNYREKHGIL